MKKIFNHAFVLVKFISNNRYVNWYKEPNFKTSFLLCNYDTDIRDMMNVKHSYITVTEHILNKTFYGEI